jgi:hypothetical protein
MCRRLTGIWLIISLLFCNNIFAQQDAFEITFTDKNNTPYSFSSPLTYLSARALARRAAQSIPLDSTDLPVNPAYIDSALHLTGGLIYVTSRWLNTCVILLPTIDSANIRNLAGKPFIKGVKQVGSYCANLYGRGVSNTSSTTAPNIPARTTSTDNTYYSDAWLQTQLVNGNYLHDQGYNGEGKLIAVFDAGFIGTNTHPWFDSLWASGRIVDTFDFTYHNTSVFNYDDHGTMVLSTMAGYVPDTFVGSAPLAMYALYVTENDIDDQPVELDNMIAAAERADSLGADVITESLGYDLFYSACSGQTFPENYDSLDGKTTVAAKAANIATKKGILFVATAGNDGTYVAGYGDYILTPGDADSALTIGAYDLQTESMASFSGYGPNSAGVQKPDVCAEGANAVVFNAFYPAQTPSPITSGSGTSFSTPQVAGWAACLSEANPSATPFQLRRAIEECASSYSSPGTQLGYGVANFECAQIALNVHDTPPPFSAANWVIATPNPVYDQLKLAVAPNADGNVSFRLMDMAGREALSFTRYCYKGYNAPITISVPQLPAGVYMIHAVSPTQQQVIKIEKR